MPTPINQLLSRTLYATDGSTTEWDFSFSGGYISKSHVKALIEAPSGERTELVVTEDMLTGPYTLRITPALTAGNVLTIYRDTPKDLPLVDFTDESGFSEVSLDTSAKQAVFIGAETVDTVNTSSSYDAEQAAAQAADSAALADSLADGAALAALSATNSANAATVSANAALAASEDAEAYAEASASTAALAVSTLENSLAAPSGASLVGYLPAGTGAVATTVQAKLRESVSVKDFGAAGDGVADDTGAIQAAITYVSEKGGGALSLIAGANHLVSGLSVTANNIEIDFNGAVLSQKTGTVNTPLLTLGDNITRYSNIKVSKARFAGNKANVSGNAAHGIAALKLSALHIDMLAAENIRRIALYASDVQGLTVGSITSTGAGVTGAALGSALQCDACVNVAVGSITSEDSSGVVTLISATKNFSVETFRASSNAVDDGLSILTSCNVRCGTYDIIGMANHGIEINSTTGVFLGPGVSESNGAYGIMLGTYTSGVEAAVSGATIVNPKTLGNATTGLRLIGCNNVGIIGATIADGAHITNADSGIVARDINFQGGGINALTVASGILLRAINTTISVLSNSGDFSSQWTMGFTGVIANGAYRDITVPALVTYSGLLHVFSAFSLSATQNTSALYHINQLGSTAVTTVSASSSATPRQVTVTCPSSGIIRITNSTGVECVVNAEWLGSVV